MNENGFELYPIEIKTQENSYYLILQGNHDEMSDLYLVEDDHLKVFDSLDALLEFAEEEEIEFDVEDPILIDLEISQRWARRLDATMDHPALLNAWTLFGDITRSLEGRAELELLRQAQAKHQALYDYLFTQAMPRSLAHASVEPVEALSPTQRLNLSRLMQLGVKIIEGVLKSR